MLPRKEEIIEQHDAIVEVTGKSLATYGIIQTAVHQRRPWSSDIGVGVRIFADVKRAIEKIEGIIMQYLTPSNDDELRTQDNLEGRAAMLLDQADTLLKTRLN
jgi:hypothetical protein